MKTIKSYLPVFPGFYNTEFEPSEDYFIEDGKTYYDYEWDNKGYEKEVAIQCTQAIQEKLAEIGINLTIDYEQVQSPAYYNFVNDAINVTYKLKSGCITTIKSYLLANQTEFSSYIKNTYTSRSGFMSFHSNNYEDWIQYATIKGLESNTHYLGSILEFILSNEGYDIIDLYYATVDRFGICIQGELKETEEV